MIRLIKENRLLSAILAWALIAGTWELTQVPPEDLEAQTLRRVELLGESYPDTPRVQFMLGLRELANDNLEVAIDHFGRSFDAGYKENENLYAGYLIALVRTQSSPERIAEVVARWQRDYPASDKLADARAQLRATNVLP